MEEPYTINVRGESIHMIPGPHNFPQDLGSPILHARAEHIIGNKIAILRQSFLGHRLFMDLCSYRVDGNRATAYATVKKPVLLFCYQLQGQIASLNKQGEQAARLLTKQYAAYNLPGCRYTLNLEKGHHLVLNFALDEQLLSVLIHNYPTLARMIREQSDLNEKQQALPLCKIDFSEKRILSRLQKIPEPKEIVELYLQDLALELIMHYEIRLQRGNFQYYKTAQEKIYEVKEFIETNYTDPFFQTNQLADEFSLSRKTLSREFKKEFGISMKDYVIKLRMTKASELLEKDYLVKEAARLNGYQNECSFSRMFKNYYGYPPEEKKSKKRFFLFV